MSRAFTPGLVVSGNTNIQRRRELPVKGKILVEEGQTVHPDQIIAEAELPGDLVILRLSERMGIEPFEVMEGLKVEEGQSINEGDVICEHAGLFGLLKTRFTCPSVGTIEFIAEKTGHIGLRLPSKMLELSAYLNGKVLRHDSQRSVEIAGHGAFLQGIFGVGGERSGVLRELGTDPTNAIEAKDIPDDCSGQILYGGASVNPEGLSQAVEAGAIGLITGAIDDRTLKQYLGYDLGIAVTGDEDVPLTLFITEGFGHLAIAERTRQVLQRCNGKLGSINGATQVRAGALRPELFVALDSTSSNDGSDAVRASGLELGRTIRLIRYPYFGLRAKVVELPEEARQIDTGAATRVLIAELEDGRHLTVPRANVELIEEIA